MRSVKAGLSTAVEVGVLERLDLFCGVIHRNRAEVIRGLLYALLIDEKQFIFHEWRALAVVETPKPKARPARMSAAERIMRVLKRDGRQTLGALKATTRPTGVSVAEWDKALRGLAEAGKLQFTDERTFAGKTRKLVVLSQEE